MHFDHARPTPGDDAAHDTATGDLTGTTVRTAPEVSLLGTDPVTGLVTRWTITPIPEWDGSLRWCRVDWVPMAPPQSHGPGAYPQSTVVTVAEAWNLAARAERL